MRNKELLRKIIQDLIKDYYENVYLRDEKENMFLIGFIKGLQYSLGMEIHSEFEFLDKKLRNHNKDSGSK